MTSYGAEHLIPFCSFQKHPFEYKEQKHTEPRGVGKGGEAGRRFEGGDICTPMANSC